MWFCDVGRAQGAAAPTVVVLPMLLTAVVVALAALERCSVIGRSVVPFSIRANVYWSMCCSKHVNLVVLTRWRC